MKKTIPLKKSSIVIAIFAIAMFFVSFSSEAVYAEGLNVTEHSKQDIINQLRNSGVSVSDPVSFSIQPIKNTQRGEMTDATKQSALAVLNNVRYIAGLDYVSLDATYGNKAQAATFVMWSTNQYGHNLSGDKPEEMPQEDWDYGVEGASKSNIGRGYSNLNRAIAHGWMEDADSRNVASVGHRRWCLNPEMGKTGFGYVNSYVDMWSFDRSVSSGSKRVAWPAQKMPVELFGNDYPWSLSTGNTSITDVSNVSVSLQRRSTSPSGSGTWSFSTSKTYTPSDSGEYFNVDVNYPIFSGQKGAYVVFRPENITYKSGDIFDVTITGLGSSAINYSVEFFNAYPVETASFDDEVFYTSPYSWNNSLSLGTTPKDAGGFEVQWSSSDESVATVSDGQVNPISPGTTTVTATIPGKYTKSGNPISASCTVIVPKSITDASISILVNSPEFNGNVAKPIVKITDTSNNYELVENKDYTLRCDGEITYPSDGSAIVWISGKGAYSGSSSSSGRYYSVRKKTISEDMITLSDTEFTYNGQIQKPDEIVVKNGGLTLREGVDYTLTNNGGKNAGNYGVTVKAITGTDANYQSSATASFTIKSKALTENMLVSGADCIYTGEKQTPNYSLKDDGVELVKGTDYTLEVDHAINRGVYTYRTKGKGNYSGVLEDSFEIKPATITSDDIELDKTSYEYDGNNKTPSVTVKVNNKTLSEVDDYRLKIDDAVNRGSYNVIVTGNGEDDSSSNYVGGGIKIFEINAKPLTADMITLSKDSFVYNAEEQAPDVTVKHGDKTLENGVDYTLSNAGGTNAGEYPVIISATSAGNYSGSSTIVFSISQKQVSEDMLQLNGEEFTYNGRIQKPAVTVKDGAKEVAEADFELSNEGGINSGEYTVTLNGKHNYSGSVSKYFSINRLGIDDQSVSVADVSPATYTGFPVTPSVTVKYVDSILSSGKDFTIRSSSENVGTSEITIEGKGNFTGRRTAQFEIIEKNIGDNDVVFDTIPQQVLEEESVTPTPIVKYNGKKLTANDYGLEYSNNSAEGEGSVIVTGKGNFTGTRTLSFKIISKETAEAQAKEAEEAKRIADEEAARKKDEAEKAATAAARAKQSGAGGAVGKGASIEFAEKSILASASDEGPKGSKFAPLMLRSTKQAKTSINLTWSKVSGAKKYVIYGNACGKKNKMKKIATVTGKAFNVKKITKKLKKGTYHKFMVVALDSKNNVVSSSKVIHVATKGNKKNANPAKLTVRKPKALKKGKTHKLAAKQVGKNVKKHRAIKYETSNAKIATVNAKGKVTAKKKGSCYIYAYAQNGVYKKVKVTVK